MYVHSYIPIQTPEEDVKWSYVIARLTAYCTLLLMFGLVISKHRKEFCHVTPYVLTETRCH